MNDLENISPKYSTTELTKFKDESKFMDAYVELLKQTIKILTLIISHRYFEGKENNPIKINRDKAIVGGNLARLIKLNTSFLENVCNEKMEICQILNRCIVETSINLLYMTKDRTENVFNNYIKNSLINEKQMFNIITQNVNNNNGEESEIEKRMLKSIEETFSQSGFKIDEINNSSKWKSLKERTDGVARSQLYKIFYSMGSHSVHGNWEDIVMFNLKKKSDGFELNLKWCKPRPQIMDLIIEMNLLVTESFVEKECLKESKSFIEKTNMLKDYQNNLINQHEKFIKK